MSRSPATPPRPPTPDETLANVDRLLAEAVGRNTLAVVEKLRQAPRPLTRTEVLVALCLARLGHASIDELAADLHNLSVSLPRQDVELAIVVLEAAGVITHDDERDAWQAVAR